MHSRHRTNELLINQKTVSDWQATSPAVESAYVPGLRAAFLPTWSMWIYQASCVSRTSSRYRPTRLLNQRAPLTFLDISRGHKGRYIQTLMAMTYLQPGCGSVTQADCKEGAQS